MGNNLPWLISECDDKKLNDEDNYWVLETLQDNGAISESRAYYAILTCRTEYNTPNCSHCLAQGNHYELKGQWKCRKCHKKFSISSGTYADNTKLELSKWWRFAYLVGEMKISNSSHIANDLNVTQKTAWLMLNSIKDARTDLGHKFVNKSSVYNQKHLYEVLHLIFSLKKANLNLKIMTPEEHAKERNTAYEYFIP